MPGADGGKVQLKTGKNSLAALSNGILTWRMTATVDRRVIRPFSFRSSGI
jgi:hypothetical protein